MIPTSIIEAHHRGLLILSELSYQLRFLVEEMLSESAVALLDFSECDRIPAKTPAKKSKPVKAKKPVVKAKKSKKK